MMKIRRTLSIIPRTFLSTKSDFKRLSWHLVTNIRDKGEYEMNIYFKMGFVVARGCWVIFILFLPQFNVLLKLSNLTVSFSKAVDFADSAMICIFFHKKLNILTFHIL